MNNFVSAMIKLCYVYVAKLYLKIRIIDNNQCPIGVNLYSIIFICPISFTHYFKSLP